MGCNFDNPSKMDALADEFIKYVRDGDASKVEKMIAEYPTLRDFPYGGERYSALYHAAYFGQLRVVAALVKAGAYLESSDNVTGETPLHGAVRDLNVEAVRFLLRAGAKKNNVDRRGYTPAEVCDELPAYSDASKAKKQTIIQLLGGLPRHSPYRRESETPKRKFGVRT